MSKNRKLWAYAWGPVILTVLLYVGLLVLLQVSIWPLLQSLVPEGIAWLTGIPVVGSIALFLLWLVAANFVIIGVSSVFSGLLWGRLSHKVETDIYGDAPDVKSGCLPEVKDFFWRLFQTAVAFVLLIAFSWLGFISAGIIGGFLGVVEFSAPAYARRGVFYPKQLGVLKTPGALGFALGAGVLSLLPLVFVFAMPALVVGGTILCRESEKPNPSRRGSGSS
jgi:uncharacterized protein involved in cysteine biosynthesis